MTQSKLTQMAKKNTKRDCRGLQPDNANKVCRYIFTHSKLDEHEGGFISAINGGKVRTFLGLGPTGGPPALKN